MADFNHVSWHRTVSPFGLRLIVIILAGLAISFAVRSDQAPVAWRLLPVLMAGAAGWIVGWLSRARRAELEAEFGLRPRRPDEPPPLDDGPATGAPVA